MRDRIAHYRIVRELGLGGMGVVYEAWDERLDRAVAVKTIRETVVDDHSRGRFLREARVAASLSHPNICQLFDLGDDDGTLYLAMELLEGRSLAARIADAPLPPAEAAQVTISILSALEVLHRRGIVHRDLKPSNVFLTPTGVKLLDFGLACPIDGGALDETRAGVTLAGTVLGTPHYLAPEQTRGQPVDARADIFSAGVVLHEMLTGTRPFAGDSIVDVLHAVLHDQPIALGGSPMVVAIDRVIHRALAKRPDDRYATASAMADDLRGVLLESDTGETSTVRPITRLIVCPLRILRGDPETDFLAFGLADAITSSLSGLGSLLVRSSEMAARLAERTSDPVVVGEKAEVDLVLTGTLLRAGAQLRVTIQLVHVPEGTVRWSQTSQVDMGDVFQLQDQLARRIVSSMSLPLSSDDQRTLRPDVPASAKAYELYLRANQLASQSSDWRVARDLYRQCVEEDPGFAPAWARLGRIWRALGAYGLPGEADPYGEAERAFERALDLNPDLALAHNLYTNLEVDLGRAEMAMVRLIQRARKHGGDPELFAGLVQACRYCGLLDASVAAYKEAIRLDPGVRTSVNHAYLMLGDYQRSIDTNVEDSPVVNIIALDLMGRAEEAIALARSIESAGAPRVIQLIASGSRAYLEGRSKDARRQVDELARYWDPRDPCARYYMTRFLAVLGHPRALEMLRQTIEGGFYVYAFLARDPWLDGLRTQGEFKSILARAEARYRHAVHAFREADGPRLLGVGA